MAQQVSYVMHCEYTPSSNGFLLSIHAVAGINFVPVVGEKLTFTDGTEGETLCHNISIIKSDECSAAVRGELVFTSLLLTSDEYIVLDTPLAEIIIDDRNDTECGMSHENMTELHVSLTTHPSSTEQNIICCFNNISVV